MTADELSTLGESVDLIHYVMDLEALVRWFALLYTHKLYDAQGNETVEVNDPIWTVYDERGTYLPEADRLQRTWRRVMHTAEVDTLVANEPLMRGAPLDNETDTDTLDQQQGHSLPNKVPGS